MTGNQVSRRGYLALAGSSFVGIAGCTSESPDTTPTRTPSTTEPEITPTPSPTPADSGTPTNTEDPGSMNEPDESTGSALSDEEELLTELSFEGAWFDTHAHWGDASFFGQNEYELPALLPVNEANEVGATILFIRADLLASHYDEIISALATEDREYLLFVGPGRRLESVIREHREVVWGIGEIPFYQGTPQYGMSLMDGWLPAAIELAAATGMPIMLHPTMDQVPDIRPVLDAHRDLTLLLHGHELTGTDEVLALLEESDRIYYTLDIGSITAPLFFESQGSSDFVERLDTNQDEFLARIIPDARAMLKVAPDRVMWGTDLVADWHVTPAAYDRIIEFSEAFLNELPEEHRAGFASENAVHLFTE